MTNTGHTPGKDDHRRPLTAQEINLLQYKLQVAESRIVELESHRDEALEKAHESLAQRATITQLKAAQRPRPMDEAPKFVEILALVRVIVTDRGTNVLNGDYQGWLPLPDQDEKTAS